MKLNIRPLISEVWRGPKNGGKTPDDALEIILAIAKIHREDDVNRVLDVILSTMESVKDHDTNVDEAEKEILECLHALA